MPGVSRKIIWHFLSLYIPVIFFLVVCGFGVTIESLKSRSLLSNVDFPALGGPMIIAKPQEKRDECMKMFYKSSTCSYAYNTKLKAEAIRKKR